MTTSELHRLGQARRDPAVTLLALVPLALLHLSGRDSSDLDAFFLVEAALDQVGAVGVAALWGCLVVGLLWSLGRIRQLQLAWAGAGSMILLEGLLWALLLGPGLSVLTQWLPLEQAPLTLGQETAPTALHQLAVAAGAGLYEELLFRALLLGAGALLLQMLFRRVAAAITARRLSYLLALLLSSAAFALAHGLHGHSEAFEPDILAFRMLAGLAFGLLYSTRGLAVVAYTHFAYDALYLLT
ncbi:MAG: CPBP family glutamic-type intramembrane protease [Planctomycetota bacterium]|jgi:membrane protease YdiL (CAAX protease family)